MLVNGVPPWRAYFQPRTAHVGFMLGEMTLGQVFIIVLVIPPGSHIYPSTADAVG